MPPIDYTIPNKPRVEVVIKEWSNRQPPSLNLIRRAQQQMLQVEHREQEQQNLEEERAEQQMPHVQLDPV